MSKSELTPEQLAMMPRYISKYVSQGLRTGTCTREDDEPIYTAVARAYKNAIKQNTFPQEFEEKKVPIVVCGAFMHILGIMRARIAGTREDVTKVILDAYHGGQFWSCTDARFRFHLEVIGTEDENLNWDEISGLYKNNAGMFMFSNIVFAIRPPVEFKEDENQKLTPVWNQDHAPTVYTPVNPFALNEDTNWDIEDIEDIPDTVIQPTIKYNA